MSTRNHLQGRQAVLIYKLVKDVFINMPLLAWLIGIDVMEYFNVLFIEFQMFDWFVNLHMF